MTRLVAPTLVDMHLPLSARKKSRALVCPACAVTTEHRFRFTVNGCEIWECPGCGLGRAATAEFDPGSYYTGDYFSGRRSDGYADYLGAEPVLRREFARSVKFIRSFCDGGRLLELGCAYGLFLEKAQPHFGVSGIELAEEAADHARRSGLSVITGSADPETMRRIGDVDVIVLFDVMEHLPDARGTLALCAAHLRPGGIIVIATGDFNSLVARLSGTHWRLMTPPQHLWFFTETSLTRMGSTIGLTLEHVSHPWKIVPLSLILFQLRRMAGLGGRC